MALSATGICTVLFIVFVGPCFWLVVSLRKRSAGDDGSGHDTSLVSSKGSGRETVSSVNYLLGLLGYAIGIGNVWRFPYVVSQNGGCAAVVAYLICNVLVAIPMYLFEFVIGQHVRSSTIEAYRKIRPRWVSLGIAQAGLVTVTVTYFQILLAYSCMYVFHSCFTPLPWTLEAMGGSGGNAEKTAETFWNKNILNAWEEKTADVGFGPIQVPLAVALGFVWIVTFLALGFGKAILQKVTWVTVLCPFILMGLLIVRSVMLEGASAGIAFYIGKFEWQKLLEAEVWATACGQIIFSLSPGFGTAITLSSYTDKKEDVFRICLIVAVANCAFSVLGGFAVFSIVGEIARQTGRTVAQVAEASDTGLAFIAIAQAMPYFGWAQNIMAVFFFVMLLTLGLDSSFAWTETVVASLEDYAAAKNIKVSRVRIVGGVSVVLFLAGLPFCTRIGNKLLNVVDGFVGSVFLLFAVALEAVMLNLDFTWERVAAAIRVATVGNSATPQGRQLWPEAYWKFCMQFTTPAAPTALGLYQLYKLVKKTIDNNEDNGDQPSWLLVIGWVLLGAHALILPLTMFNKEPGTLVSVAELNLRGVQADSEDEGVELENKEPLHQVRERLVPGLETNRPLGESS